MMSDAAVKEPVLQGLWNAVGIFLMAQIHCKPGDKMPHAI
jgi:hypothetical protein